MEAKIKNATLTSMAAKNAVNIVEFDFCPNKLSVWSQTVFNEIGLPQWLLS